MVNELYYKDLLNRLIEMPDEEWEQMDLMFEDITENYQCVSLPDNLFCDDLTELDRGDVKNILVKLFMDSSTKPKEKYKNNDINFISQYDIIDVFGSDYNMAANDEQYAIAA